MSASPVSITPSYLYETPPFCPTAACFMHQRHGTEAEHHVEECPVSATLAAQVHRVSDALWAASDSLLAELVEVSRLDRLRRWWL